jgi:hypothetical protein
MNFRRAFLMLWLGAGSLPARKPPTTRPIDAIPETQPLEATAQNEPNKELRFSGPLPTTISLVPAVSGLAFKQSLNEAVISLLTENWLR